jgi:hypothetical protein
MLRTTLALVGCTCMILLSSCCQPSHKDSSPYVVNSLFQETYGRDLDLYNQDTTTETVDSAYYPIYTFAIQNTGTADDQFTLQLTYRQGIVGYTITKLVPAGQVVLFQSPLAVPDSITENATYSYLAFQGANPNIDIIYDGLSFQSTDSAEIHAMQPTVSIIYGLIDNGPEGCNTPASTMSVNIDSLPTR